MELLHDYHILNTEGSNTFLKGNDAYLVHVSSVINEDYINGNSNRYYEMRTPNARLTKVMCMTAFRNTPKEYISKLLHYIERDNSKFNIDFNISTPSWSKEQKMIAVKQGLTIIDYIQISAQDYDVLAAMARLTSFFLYKADVAAIFGPGTPVAYSAKVVMQLLMQE